MNWPVKDRKTKTKTKKQKNKKQKERKRRTFEKLAFFLKYNVKLYTLKLPPLLHVHSQ